MNERLQVLEAVYAAKEQYLLTILDGTTEVLPDIRAVMLRCFQNPCAPKVLHFEPLHSGPHGKLPELLNCLLESPNQKDA